MLSALLFFGPFFVKTLLYLCISYFTLVAFSMYASLVDMRMSGGIMCESFYFGGLVLFLDIIVNSSNLRIK